MFLMGSLVSLFDLKCIYLYEEDQSNRKKSYIESKPKMGNAVHIGPTIDYKLFIYIKHMYVYPFALK